MPWLEKYYETVIESGYYRLLLEGFGNTLLITVGNFIITAIVTVIRVILAFYNLIIGLISLIPGSSLYYTINHVLKSEMSQFADRGMKTIAIAGLMAAGILLVSTSVRMIYEGKKHLLTRKKLP